MAQANFSHRFRVLIFGDLTATFEDDLTRLLHCKGNVVLQSFFSLVAVSLRQELVHLSAAHQRRMPRFTTLIDLVANMRGTEAESALRFMLLTVYQIGRILLRHEQGFDLFAPETATKTVALGLCTGSFGAAAIAVSRSASDLVDAGIAATIVAFRTALHSLAVRELVQKQTLSDQIDPWSMIVQGSPDSLGAVLETFASHQGIPNARRPYISAVGHGNVTISGPPHLLNRLVQHAALRATKLQGIVTPVHAPHLFNSDDLSNLITCRPPHGLKDQRTIIPFVSPADGTFHTEASLSDLLSLAVRSTLGAQLRWDLVQESIVHHINTGETFDQCILVPCAAASAASSLSSHLSVISHQVRVTVDSALTEPVDLSSPARPTGNFEDSRIAITGFSGRFPDAESTDALWELLCAGLDVHRLIPPDRFDWEAHYDPSGKKRNTSRVKYGCFVPNPGHFDARFFNISAREAEQADPAQRLALLCAYETMEMAGFVPNRTPSTQQDRVGVFMGITSDDWRETNSGQDIDTYFIPGGNRAFLPGRISHFFKFSGPSLSIDTACSSSFASIQTACSYLWRGECDTAVAGGANILTNPDNFAGLDRGWFLSHTGNCQAFDEKADGYCRADAVGTVMLKRLEDAEADGDPIFGIILGSNTNHCGNTDSITRPFEDDQAAVFKQVLRRSYVDPKDVSYIEMHGTGTQAGDATEFASVLGTFDVPNKGRVPNHPLHLGTIKANIGHAESASGVVSLIKVLMMMQHNQIPPHVGIKTRLNPKIPADLAQRNVHIPLALTAWNRLPGKQRTVFLNNFSAAGGNTAILLQDAPERLGNRKQSTFPDEAKILTVSGKTLKACRNNAFSLAQLVEKGPEFSLEALSYTTTARRVHHAYRVAILADDWTSLATQLHQCEPCVAPKTPTPIVFVFSGQGVIYRNLGRQLYERVQPFRDEIRQFNALAEELCGSSFLPLISSDEAGDYTVLDSPVTTQLAICSIQMALASLLRSWGVEPSAVTGHSLGEYAALATAGVLTPADAIYLVYKRAELLTERCTQGTHAMLAIKASLSDVEPHLRRGEVDIACLNAPNNTVIAGPLTSIQPLKYQLEKHNMRCMLLDIPFAFHSAQVDPILASFESICEGVELGPLKMSYFSPLTGNVMPRASQIEQSYLVRACRGTVKFEEAVRNAMATLDLAPNTLWLELGSHPICSHMLKGIVGPRAVHIHSLERGASPVTTISRSMQSLYLAGANIDWNEYQRDFCHAADRRVVPLPRYGWDLSNYWIDYRNNFCLTKGSESKAPVAIAQVAEPRISSSVHRILEQPSPTQNTALVVQTDLLDPVLANVIDGHKVHGSLLCTSSLYADIALTAAKYLLMCHGRVVDVIDLNCGHMTVGRPVIVDRTLTQQHLQTKLIVDRDTTTIHCSFHTIRNQSQIDHANCTVTLSDTSLLRCQWSRQAFLVGKGVEVLQRSVEDGSAHRMKRGMVYKLFGALVDYSDHFQGMQEVYLDSQTVEGSALVRFQVAGNGFSFHPCWIDSLGSIAGFIMNAREGAKPGFVYINHGWESIRRAAEFSQDKTYTTYNHMHRQGDSETYVGDTYVLDGDDIVAVLEGVRFQGVPAATLRHLLPSKEPPAPVVSTKASFAPPSPSVLRINSKTATQPMTKAPQPPISAPLITSNQAGLSKNRQILALLADELRTDIEMLDLDADLADLGVDSLLSLTLCARLREELDLELTSSALANFDSVRALVSYLADDSASDSESSIQSDQFSVRAADTENDLASAYSLPATPPSEDEVAPILSVSASSVMLQGSFRKARKVLHLFPDGSGSAASYSSIGNIDPDVAVVGLNCPFLKEPHLMTCSLEAYVHCFLKEIRRRQPQGPYTLGGWSAGGILAFEAVKQLIQAGEQIDGLILIDSPNPIGLENPPARLYDFFDQVGVFGFETRSAPKWLRPHFDAFLKMLNDYVATISASPDDIKTWILYARDGLCKDTSVAKPEIRSDDPREMRWLLEDRIDFTAEGWKRLVGGETAVQRIDVVDGVNHFSLVADGPHMAQFAAFLRSASA